MFGSIPLTVAQFCVIEINFLRRLRNEWRRTINLQSIILLVCVSQCPIVAFPVILLIKLIIFSVLPFGTQNDKLQFYWSVGRIIKTFETFWWLCSDPFLHSIISICSARNWRKCLDLIRSARVVAYWQLTKKNCTQVNKKSSLWNMKNDNIVLRIVNRKWKQIK